jgi:hypothetical protein
MLYEDEFVSWVPFSVEHVFFSLLIPKISHASCRLGWTHASKNCAWFFLCGQRLPEIHQLQLRAWDQRS